MKLRHGVLLIATLPLPGCFYSIENRCEDVRYTGMETRGDLVGVESEANGAAMPEYSRKQSVTTNGIEREVIPVRDDFGHDEAAIVLDLAIVFLKFDRPLGRGATTLAALGAHVCERTVGRDGDMCHGVDGDVDVAEIAEPCGDGVCGAIDITIRVAEPNPLPPEAVVYGSARLLYREWKEKACKMVHEGSDSAFAVEH